MPGMQTFIVALALSLLVGTGTHNNLLASHSISLISLKMTATKGGAMAKKIDPLNKKSYGAVTVVLTVG